jgi:hypothetical protein
MNKILFIFLASLILFLILIGGFPVIVFFELLLFYFAMRNLITTFHVMLQKNPQ